MSNYGTCILEGKPELYSIKSCRSAELTDILLFINTLLKFNNRIKLKVEKIILAYVSFNVKKLKVN